MSETKAKPVVDMCTHPVPGLIVLCRSGVLYTTQTAGTLCGHPMAEGVFVPLPGVFGENAFDMLADCGAYDGCSEEEADAVDAILAARGQGKWLKVDRSRLNESAEAWVYVEIASAESDYVPVLSGFGPYPMHGILTWENSD